MLSLPAAALTAIVALIAITPDPIAFHLGPIPVFWYGVCYAAGLAAVYTLITREAARRGLNPRFVDNGIIIVAIAALIGGRMYHVIDQWQRYASDPLAIILPPYSGLGVYGGILTGTLAALYVTRRGKQSFWRWADVIAPGLFVMQAIGRWGNFFNQELYGPPTDLPWGIAIDCAHRVEPYACAAYPAATTGFQPLFLYESLSGAIGAVTLLWIARRWGSRMRPGDLVLVFFIWYAAVRFVLETLRTGNTFNGIPTAMLISTIVIVGSVVILAYRHRPGAGAGDPWGDPDAVPADDEGWFEDDVDAGDDADTAAADEGGADTADEGGADTGEPDAGEPDAGTDEPAVHVEPVEPVEPAGPVRPVEPSGNAG
ncbi:MAG: prolipoprotein diacylglyceryl transferase [Chloroflexota bacterium]